MSLKTTNFLYEDLTSLLHVSDVNNTKIELISWFPSKEIVPDDIPLDVSDINEFACNDFRIKHVSATSVLDLLEDKEDTNLAVLNANQSHSDLLTAIYEGKDPLHAIIIDCHCLFLC